VRTPEFDTSFDWDMTRGLGARIEAPVVSGAEENLLRYPGDPYGAENIFVHEFAQTLFEYGLVAADKRTLNPNTSLLRVYWTDGGQLLTAWLAVHDSAIESGRWAGERTPPPTGRNCGLPRRRHGSGC
jgi:hypothetical protein